jgi:hypothetical protein
MPKMLTILNSGKFGPDISLTTWFEVHVIHKTKGRIAQGVNPYWALSRPSN